jgi:hypothetical protein
MCLKAHVHWFSHVGDYIAHRIHVYNKIQVFFNEHVYLPGLENVAVWMSMKGKPDCHWWPKPFPLTKRRTTHVYFAHLWIVKALWWLNYIRVVSQCETTTISQILHCGLMKSNITHFCRGHCLDHNTVSLFWTSRNKQVPNWMNIT